MGQEPFERLLPVADLQAAHVEKTAAGIDTVAQLLRAANFDQKFLNINIDLKLCYFSLGQNDRSLRKDAVIFFTKRTGKAPFLRLFT
ncbi:MAG: hypothetical protein K2F92_03235 [Alistipes sp.]|nr:hypothetical protein [Alistipes sp.]